MLLQIVATGLIVNAAVGRQRVGVGRAVLGHVDRRIAILRLQPPQHLEQPGGVYLPAHLAVAPAALAPRRVRRGAADPDRKPLRPQAQKGHVPRPPHPSAGVVVDAHEVERRANRRHVARRDGRPKETQPRPQWLRIAPAKQGIEKQPVHGLVGQAGGGAVTLAVRRRVDGGQV